MRWDLYFALAIRFGATLGQRVQNSEGRYGVLNTNGLNVQDSALKGHKEVSIILTQTIQIRSVKESNSSETESKAAQKPLISWATSPGAVIITNSAAGTKQQNTLTIDIPPKPVASTGNSAPAPPAIVPPQPTVTAADATNKVTSDPKATVLTGSVPKVAPTAAALPVVTSPSAVAQPGAAPTGNKPGAVITLGDSIYTAGPNGLAIGPTTLAPGGAVAIVAGQIVSVGLEFVVVDGSVIPYTPILPPPQAATFSLQGQIYTAGSTGVSIGSVTLKPGAPATTISGQYVSAGSKGIVVGKNTISFTEVPPMTTVVGGVFTLGSSPYTYLSGSGMVVAGVTLVAGGPGTMISGIPVSVGPSGVVVGTDSFAMSTVTRTLNGFIASSGIASITTATGSPSKVRLASLNTGIPSAGERLRVDAGWGSWYKAMGLMLSVGYLLI